MSSVRPAWRWSLRWPAGPAVDLADLLFALEEAVGRPEVPGLTRPGTAAVAPADAEAGEVGDETGEVGDEAEAPG